MKNLAFLLLFLLNLKHFVNSETDCVFYTIRNEGGYHLGWSVEGENKCSADKSGSLLAPKEKTIEIKRGLKVRLWQKFTWHAARSFPVEQPGQTLCRGTVFGSIEENCHFTPTPQAPGCVFVILANRAGFELAWKIDASATKCGSSATSGRILAPHERTIQVPKGGGVLLEARGTHHVTKRYAIDKPGRIVCHGTTTSAIDEACVHTPSANQY